ncbi:MAG: hypothetical protein IJZ32_03605 [Clostridia bacterium]|nr:hypothetical protein [Clostridia bacterium]
MLKALLKKQFYEMTAFLFISSKTGKRREPVALLGFGLLMLYAVGAVGYMFWLIAKTLCAPLVTGGLAWVYFALTGIMAAAFSCIGSIFTAKIKLYEAKDNDLLLSLPVKPWQILFSRMVGLYVLAFFFSAVVFVPAVAQYFITVGFSVLPAVYCLLITLLLPLGVLAVCSLLGWLIALVTSRIRAKNLVTVVLLLAFLAGYFYLYSKLNDYLNYVIAHGAAVGAKIRTALYPFWKMGLAAAGDGLALLPFAGLLVGVFAIAYILLSVTFLSVVTTKRGEVRPKYKEKPQKQGSAFFALLRKETGRFFKNPMLALNCLLGSLMALVLPVAALFNIDFLTRLSSADGLGQELAVLLFTALVCGVVATNIISASSVSLEGETLWLVKSLPVKTGKILAVKTAFHCLVTAVPVCIFTLTVGILLRLNALLFALALLIALAFTVFCAALGLVINLALPNLHWTNEVTAVKQSASPMLAMFSGIGAVALFVLGYFAFGKHLPAWGYMLICLAVLVTACIAMAVWLAKKGAELFERL